MDPIGLVLRRSGATIYRDLAELVVISLITAAALVLVFPAGMALGGVFAAAASGREGRALLESFFRGARRLGAQGTAVFLAAALLLTILFATWRYHLAVASFFSWTLLAFQCYMIGGFLFTQLYTLPLLAAGDLPLRVAVRTSLALALRHPAYTAGVWVQLLCAAALLALTVVGVPLLGASLAVIVHEAARNAVDTHKQGDP